MFLMANTPIFLSFIDSRLNTVGNSSSFATGPTPIATRHQPPLLPNVVPNLVTVINDHIYFANLYWQGVAGAPTQHSTLASSLGESAFCNLPKRPRHPPVFKSLFVRNYERSYRPFSLQHPSFQLGSGFGPLSFAHADHCAHFSPEHDPRHPQVLGHAHVGQQRTEPGRLKGSPRQ